ncbi:MAG: GNAT family N-acetyltransferase [Planctomycetota bacterium]|jgi:CelD/BcsL family acetyltransferase involved in cellulose biosynthesis|nr:GNAT family N-acetyltransferase [Planctomycetota bacterium]
MPARVEIRSLLKDEWSQASAAFLDYTYLQTWDYGIGCAAQVGAVSEHLAVRLEGEIIALSEVRTKRVPGTGTGVAAIRTGPLVRRGLATDGEHLNLALHALRAHFVDERGLVLRLLGIPSLDGWSTTQEQAMLANGFRSSSRGNPYRTIIVDLDRDAAAVRAGLHRKWRNHLNRGERNGLEITVGDSDELFDQFLPLYESSAERKGFSSHLNGAFYRALHAALPAAERFRLRLVHSAQGELLGGAVSSFLGDTCHYVMGGINPRGMRDKASYVLQWHVIEEAMERGLKLYELGGIDPVENPTVHHFKDRMGGEDVWSPGPMECLPRGLGKWAALAAEGLYRSLRRPNRRGDA